MKVSLEWLRELVNIKLDGENLAEVLTRGGIEVGSVESLSEGLDQVVIGQIKEMQIHPDADKLWLCRVDTGSALLTLVTGAQNLLVGDKVPVALAGAELPNGASVQEAKFRGVVSQGMLCSAEELLLDQSVGLERSEGGILILAPEAPVGEHVADFLGLKDSVLDLELYPNRPDCLAMVNVAREISSLTGAPVNLPKWALAEKLGDKLDLPLVQDVKIVIEDPELCFRYAGLIVEDVKIEPAPEWMQRRLRAAGVRPINNIVDITNYVMLELGQPLHAFDRDKIQGAVHVRRAHAGEVLTTLDQVERKLETDMLLIADEMSGLGLAGVMGGLDSEVTSGTKRLLVEAAHFAGVSIRRTSRRLGLRSEASNRFEKGINPYGVLATLGRVSELLLEIGAGRPVGYVDEVSYLPPLAEVTLSVKRAGEVLGTEVTAADVKGVLDRLNFEYTETQGLFTVKIPSYRSDIQIEEDLIEEVARLTGYDLIPTTLPAGDLTQGMRTPGQEIRRRLRQVLIGAGMNEVLTYSFTRPDTDRKWGKAEQRIALMNPLREELSVMRTSLVPGLLEVAVRNLSRRNTDVAIFEMGNVYLSEEETLTKLPQEELRAAGLAVGKSERHWLSPVLEYDFYYLKGVLEELAKEFGLSFAYRALTGEELLHPGRSAAVYLGEQRIGFLGELHPRTAKELDLERAVVFEIEVQPLIEQAGTQVLVQAIPRFPAVQRDLALIVPKETPAAAVVAKIRSLGGELLQEVEVFDVYTGKQVPEDRKSLAFSLRYQSLERTLKDEEVNELNSRILEGIQQEFAAEWRK
ncbi:phenylalanine--tRNA ligase subunit beta [Paradesulfitobacterium ferrireducens]|uniref:phenylalanine--tRNA ligase subunit beta n=1 Tax=Paradesulfitobacterium ferrireducens TaxID=2816476 RepID=UPI001A8CC2B9|nr:phenylalanine--tRNA ligase subunit beta [Paradesulfitobacterium ferrireducens]